MPPTHVYKHPAGHGFGHHHADAEGTEQSAEMRDLDMAPGTPAELVATEEDTGRLVFSWQDATGNPRMTTVDPQFAAEHFVTEGA